MTQRFADKLRGIDKRGPPPWPGSARGSAPSLTQHIEGGRVGKTHVPLQAEPPRTSLTEYKCPDSEIRRQPQGDRYGGEALLSGERDGGAPSLL